MRVLMFARARELAGTDALDVQLGDEKTVGDLRRVLSVQCPKLTALLTRSAIAVNGEYSDDSRTLPADAEIAVIPPVSGG